MLIQRVTSNGVRTDTPTMLPFVFATVPELVAYDDGQGDKATINYPVDPDTGLEYTATASRSRPAPTVMWR